MECTSKAGKQNKNEPTRTAGLASLCTVASATTRINGGVQQRRSAGNLEPTKLRSRIRTASIAGTVTKSGDKKPSPGVEAVSTTKSRFSNSRSNPRTEAA
ncbi:hypothetical protein KQX54_011116 [Cotesia glomerata]|uniref:Uncharacterized protein n=1 Tax=Cotesia glomerata TaxID=32391 RepID=A0AAV7I2T4_COTGL|nr:hypothetical protein KQX54_011116 [Cotesia glomerata]